MEGQVTQNAVWGMAILEAVAVTKLWQQGMWLASVAYSCTYKSLTYSHTKFVRLSRLQLQVLQV